MASPSSMCETGHPKPLYWDSPEGWDGEGGGGFRMGAQVHPWLIHINVWQKPPQYCNLISLKINK